MKRADFVGFYIILSQALQSVMIENATMLKIHKNKSQHHVIV
jgi:hypothetical protein